MPLPSSALVETDQVSLYPNGEQILNDYVLEEGVCVLPVAEDPPSYESGLLATWSPVAVLRLHAPYRIRRARYKADKQNNPPVLPATGNAGAFVYLGGTVGITNALNPTFRNFDWRVQTEYVYVENCVSRIQDGFVLGNPGWTWNTSYENRQTPPSAPAPTVGAVASAGPDAVIGYKQGIVALQNSFTSSLGWGYNTASYLSGVFFCPGLTNAETT